MSELSNMVVEELKKEGMSIAKELGRGLINGGLNILEKVVIASDNKVDDILIGLVPLIRKPLLGLIDTIGEEKG